MSKRIIISGLSKHRQVALMEKITSKNGKFLSQSKSSPSKIKIKCEAGHIFENDIRNILYQENWCGHEDCKTRRRQKTIAAKMTPKIAQIIEQKKGTWVSGDYVNMKTPIFIDCDNGHSAVPITPEVLLRGGWCKKCAGKLSPAEAFEKLLATAKRNGGLVLSSEYLGAKEKHRFQCGKCGHIWSTTPSAVNGGSWCGQCSASVKLPLENYKRRASDILSQLSYKLTRVRRTKTETESNVVLEYECDVGHKNSQKFHNFLVNPHCRSCNPKGVRESLCRAILEDLLNHEFPSKRPKWLHDVSGQRLELDGYNQLLGLAFEHQGQQHYEFTPHFHNSVQDFLDQQKRDQHKRALCSSHDVTLLEIPFSVPNKRLAKWIRSQLTSLGFEAHNREIDINQFKVGRSSYIAEVLAAAAEKNISLVSGSIQLSRQRVEWRCDVCEHTWLSTPSRIKEDRTKCCPKCAHVRKSKNFETPHDEILRLANASGLTLEKKVYGRFGPEYELKCANGHAIKRTASRLKRGIMCQKCRRLLKDEKDFEASLERLKSYLNSRDFKLVSQNYLGSQQKLLVECPQGHFWQASPSVIFRGSNCGVCTKRAVNLSQDEKKAILSAERVIFDDRQKKLTNASALLKNMLALH